MSGEDCWDEYFLAENCCKHVVKPDPANNAGFDSPDVCHLDDTCFNDFFNCEKCCSGDGLSNDGQWSCFDDMYPRDRCCNPAFTGGFDPATGGNTGD